MLKTQNMSKRLCKDRDMACDTFLNACRSGYLAAGELAEVRFEVLSDHCINGHQAEHTGFPHAALRVVITLFNQITNITNLQGTLFETKELEENYSCMNVSV